MASNQMTDIVPVSTIAARYQMRRFFSYLETRGGTVGNKHVLFVYNASAPELSYIITEPITNEV
jgi:hypothetical protein